MSITIKRRSELLNCTIEQSQAIDDLIHHRKQPEDYPNTSKWINSCFNEPPRSEKLMEAFNEILGGYGVEACQESGNYHDSPLVYINMGDTYTPTICYYSGKYHYESWGDALEKLENEGIVFN